MKKQAFKLLICGFWLVAGFTFVTFFPRFAQSQTVKLAWSPNTDQSISHYNIYRKSEESNFQLRGSTGHPDTIYVDQDLEWEVHYFYVATAVDIYGNESGYSNMIDTTLALATDIENDVLPDEYQMHQNFPNPFNSSTNITYFLPVPDRVSFSIFNIQGKTMFEQRKSLQSAGQHTIHWDGRASNGIIVSAGVYFYKLETPNFVKVRKLTLLK